MRIDDADALHAFFSDPVAMEYWSKPHTTREETKERVRGTVQAPATQTREYSVLLDDRVIGNAGIWKSPELGYCLLREFWGHATCPKP